ARTREFDAAIIPFPDERVARDPVPRRRERIESAARTETVVDLPSKKPKRVGLAAGGLAVLASVLFFASSRLPGRATSEPSPIARPSRALASATPISAATRAAAVVAPTRLAVAHRDSLRTASARPVSAAPVPKSPQPIPPAENHSAVSGMPLLPTIGSLGIAETTAPNVDSVLRATTPRRDTDTDQIGSAGRLRTPMLGEDRSETPPVLIGVVPQPRFPDALRAQRIEGAVVVQFLVGADGSVDQSSMKVVRSPHELFTEAVRNVLPKLHFQPARSADAKAHAEWVQYTIQFSATK
ncbi:MAG: energy transducer TonB, partial [bacterium]